MKQHEKGKANRKAQNKRAYTKKNSAVTKNGRMTLVVGEPWTEPIENIEVRAESSRKDGVNVFFACAFILLLFALTARAMVIGDQATLKESLDIDKMGLACVAVWAGGKAVLKVLSGWQEKE